MSPRRKPRRPRFAHYLEYGSLVCLTALARLVRVRWYGVLARWGGAVWFRLFPIRRKVVLGNLALAFPEKPAGWRKRTAGACAAHFARMGLEFLDVGRRGPAALEEMMGGIEGLEHYEAAGGNRGPYVFVTGHLGNWELPLSYFAAFKGLRMAVVAKPLHNRLIERVVARVRVERGYEIVQTRGDFRGIVRALRGGKPVAFVADQDARRTGIFVPFFGVAAATFQGPALLAHRLNLPLLVGTCSRCAEGGRYRLRFFPPFVPDPKADRQAEIERLTRGWTALLEAAIRESPEQYFWFHRRWKTRPREKT